MSVKLIKDNLLGNVIFSNLESEIFSDPLFNRLHHITQNAMAYKVFPSDRTSRFSHSIGVMHISSNIFKNGLSNTQFSTVNEFFEDKLNIINGIIDTNIENLPGILSSKFRRGLNKKNILEEMYNYLVIFFNENFINYITYYNKIFENKKYISLYILLIESLRISALLHDIGHLPFSHLTEYAFEDLYNKLANKNTSLNNKEKEYKNYLDNVIMGEFKIHEIIQAVQQLKKIN